MESTMGVVPAMSMQFALGMGFTIGVVGYTFGICLTLGPRVIHHSTVVCIPGPWRYPSLYCSKSSTKKGHTDL